MTSDAPDLARDKADEKKMFGGLERDLRLDG